MFIFVRVFIIFSSFNPFNSNKIYTINVPFIVLLTLIVFAELILYRKLGSHATKYSNLIDALFFVAFIGEWMTSLYGIVNQAKQGQVIVYGASTIFGFTGFSWRTLIQNFIVQRWQLKVIPPIFAYIFVIIFSIRYDSQTAFFTLLKGITQMIYIVCIFYLEDKVNFKLLQLNNLQQDKWVRINEFILENIPEKIAILDLQGELKYMTEYFKNYIKKFDRCDNVTQFFKEVQNLQIHHEDGIQPTHGESSGTEKSGCCDSNGEHTICNRPFCKKIACLKELITIFRGKIELRNIEERSFFIFNGKFIPENSQEERSLEVKISFIRQQAKPHIILILRDTTQRDQVLTLEGNIKYKDHLLASVSHELRTPLNGNINLVEAAIKREDISRSVKEKLLIPALKSSKFLLHLINDILDMSQMKAKKLRLTFQNMSLKETLLNTINLVELQAQKKGIKLEINFDPLLPAYICTDHVRLSQIVLNLVNNSIKFTQQGLVRLTVAPLKVLNCVKVSVEDTGIGMSQEDINKLFKDYTHIESKTRSNINPSGVGLGLSIAYNLAKLLGPSENPGIKVTSFPNKGSKFSFLIEDKSADSQYYSKSVSSNMLIEETESTDVCEADSEPTLNVNKLNLFSTKPLKKPLTSIDDNAFCYPICECSKILLVDDDPFNILAYESVLNSLNMKYDSVYSGKSAIEKLVARFQHSCGKDCCSYSVVLMDQEMPGMNGVETVREIRALEEKKLLPKIRIVGCTAHQDRDEIDKFMRSGIDDCIQKPISAATIRKIIGRIE